MTRPLNLVLLEQTWRAEDNPLLTAAYEAGKETATVIVLPSPPAPGSSPARQQRHALDVAAAEACRSELHTLGASVVAMPQGAVSELLAALAAARYAVTLFREEDPLALFPLQIPEGVVSETLPLFTLLHPNDLPIKRTRVPDLFKDFKKQIAPFVLVRRAAARPTVLPAAKPDTHDILQAFAVEFAEPEPKPPPASPIVQLDEWFADRKQTTKYHLERQKLAGNTTEFARWLGTGALSPRAVWWAAKRFETEHGRNRGTAQLLEQLLRRCFYRLLAVKHGTDQLRPGGLLNLGIAWQDAPAHLLAWQTGQTGYPIVDACMRELNATGLLSNRGRRIAATFLTRYLGIDWQKGERYFAEHLLDYNPYNNIGNWQAASGVGEDVRQFRFLDVLHQTERFDPDGQYIKAWVPELRTLTATQIHQPWQLSADVLQQAGLAGSVYAAPIIEAESSLKQNALRYKTALDNAGLKYPKSLVSRFVRKHDQKRRL